MALVMGTNAGFVTTAPTAAPGGGGYFAATYSHALKDTSPVGAGKIVEIGWYTGTATDEENFEVGIYAHNSGEDEPETVVGSISTTNAKGTTAGWKRVTGLNIPINDEIIYWLAVQCDGNYEVKIDAAAAGGVTYQRKSSQTSLPSPWGDSNSTFADTIIALYAVWEEGEPPAGTNIQVNIGDTWKEVPAMQINIGDTWKEVVGVQQNIGDSWKEVF